MCLDVSLFFKQVSSLDSEVLTYGDRERTRLRTHHFQLFLFHFQGFLPVLQDPLPSCLSRLQLNKIIIIIIIIIIVEPLEHVVSTGSLPLDTAGQAVLELDHRRAPVTVSHRHQSASLLHLEIFQTEGKYFIVKYFKT